MTRRHSWVSIVALAIGATGASSAQADDPGPTGAPPADAKAMVEAKKVADALTIKNKDDDQTATVSVGGMQTTGNSRSRAGTASGAYDLRRSVHAFGASLLGNYSEGRQPGASGSVLTAENLQGRVRYEYYFN